MPVPKRKRSRARRDSRFANKGIKVKAITACANCNNPLITHAACLNCGFYKGIKVLNTKADRTLRRVALSTTREASKAKKQAAQSPEKSSE